MYPYKNRPFPTFRPEFRPFVDALINIDMREKTHINEIFQEAIMDPTQWSKFHAQMGVRIVADQKRWLQEHTSKNPLVNLTNSV